MVKHTDYCKTPVFEIPRENRINDIIKDKDFKQNKNITKFTKTLIYLPINISKTLRAVNPLLALKSTPYHWLKTVGTDN